MVAEIFGVDGVIVLVVVLALLFGGAAIPKLARSLGSAHNEFKKGLSEGGAEGDGATTPEVTPEVAPASEKPASPAS